MYEIKITPLTKSQIRNLGNGKGVRVYAGDYPVEVDKKQYTRFHKNMSLGKAFTLKVSGKKGAGIISDLYRYIKERPVLRGMANRAIYKGKQYAHKGVDYLSNKAHQKIREFPMIDGSGIRKRTRRGRGLVGAALSGGGELAGLIGGPGSSEAKQILGGIGTVANILGLGMKKKKQTRRGRGLVGAALSGGGELAGLIGGPGSDEAKKWLGGIGSVANALGLGMKKKKKASPAQLAALARGRGIRDANRRKIGSGRCKKYGTALRPAGY